MHAPSMAARDGLPALFLLLATGALLHGQTLLFEFAGVVSNNDLGAAVAPAGDVDGDGTPDVIAGAPGSVGGAIPRAFVLSGAGGTVLATYFGVVNSAFGSAVAGISDLDGDGRAEVAVGAYFAGNVSGAGSSFGLVRVLSGASGATLFTINGGPNSALGRAVAAAGDVNGDGIPDFAVGAPAYFSGAGTVPVVEVRSGADASMLLVMNGGIDSGFGAAIAGGRDVDGDLIPDFLVGLPAVGAIAGGGGSAEVRSGAGGGLLFALSLPGLTNGAGFGSSVAWVDDVDGDQVADAIVGAPNHDAGTFSGAIDVGRVGVFSGATGALLFDIVGPAAPSPLASSRLGASVAGLGDLDADGIPELAAGAPAASSPTSSSGRVLVYSGADASLVWNLAPPPNGFGAMLGAAVANAGDLDGDGNDELVVGAPRAGAGDTGLVRVYRCTAAFDFGQPAGPGSLLIRNTCGRPLDLYWTALTFDVANASALGTGWWYGLNIPFLELVGQFAAGAPPFIGTLDAAGTSAFAIPAGGAAFLAGLTLYGVTTTYAPPFGVQTGVSNTDALTIL